MTTASASHRTGSRTAMTPAAMTSLIDEHIAAETAGDTAGAVAMYTNDVIHDVVGAPSGPLQGPDAARSFYDYLTANVTTERMDVNHSWYGENFCVIEHQCTASVPGEFLGIPGNGKRVSFRILHVWEFTDRRISRENIWMDGNAIVAQLTSP
jgi:steroid delta-isomerase-like uncharacterized protein